jgi:hypothetical protein
MEIKENGAWLQNDDGYSGHMYVQSMSNILNRIVLENKANLVYDFGCGFGDYTKNISRLGVETIGFEAYPDKRNYDNIQQADLSEPLLLDRKADIAISLEVGEHIPAEFEDIFIDNICNNAKDIVILSWAVEGQSGDGHINCRNNDHIIAQMSKRGFVFDESILEIRKEADEMLWFEDSLMLFRKATES